MNPTIIVLVLLLIVVCVRCLIQEGEIAANDEDMDKLKKVSGMESFDLSNFDFCGKDAADVCERLHSLTMENRDLRVSLEMEEELGHKSYKGIKSSSDNSPKCPYDLDICAECDMTGYLDCKNCNRKYNGVRETGGFPVLGDLAYFLKSKKLKQEA